MAAGGMLCLKGSNPNFLLAPAALPRVAEPQVQRLEAPSRSSGPVGVLGFAGSFAATAMMQSLLGRASRAQVRKTSVGARSNRSSEEEGQIEFATSNGEVACANWVFSAKSTCVHPERKDPYLCGDCPRNGKAPTSSVCATAALVSSAKSACIHPERKEPYLCGDCPRNPKMAAFAQDEKVCAAAFVSSAKSQCVHPERKDPYLCGDCPRNGKNQDCARFD